MRVDSRRIPGERDIAGEVLRLLTASTDADESVDRLLELACLAADAEAAWFVSIVPALQRQQGQGPSLGLSPAGLEERLARLEPGLSLNPPALKKLAKRFAWILAVPLQVERRTIGGLILSLRGPNSADSVHLLDPIIHGLAVLANQLRREHLAGASARLAGCALNAISDPVIVMDESNRVMMMNPAAEAALGMSSDAAAGYLWRDVPILNQIAAGLESDPPSPEWSRDGLEQVFEPRVEPLRDAAGNAVGTALVLNNVSRFKKLNRNHTEFMRLVSHDLRTPLTVMKGYANLLEISLGDDERHQKSVAKILSGIDQMDAIVANIQDAGRYDPETGFYELRRGRCDLREIIRRIVDTHLVPVEKQLTITLDIDRSVPVVNADANMMERAITNLVDNAIKYTPDGGQIVVGCHAHDRRVIISVRDTGYGISPENQQRLFQRHARIERQEHRKIKGTGLGLFIVRSVAQHHGGHAWVESVEGEGSTFFISLPLEGDNLFTGQLALPFDDL